MFSTCVHCLHVSQSLSVLGQLKRLWGLSAKEHAALMVNAKHFSKATPLKQWLRDVTEEGTWWVSSVQGARQQGAPNWKGGLCVGVHEDIGCLLMAAWQHDEGELIMLDFRRFNLLAAWRCPDGTRDTFDAEVALWAGQATASDCPLLAFDWNDPFAELGYQFIAPTDQGQLVPRWKGTLPIDWACTNDPCAEFEACLLESRMVTSACDGLSLLHFWNFPCRMP